MQSVCTPILRSLVHRHFEFRTALHQLRQTPSGSRCRILTVAQHSYMSSIFIHMTCEYFMLRLVCWPN
ncbi:unnamed protein product [Ixodes pacificus]